MLLAGIFSLASPAALPAQEGFSDCSSKWASWQIQEENDFFVSSDEFYTQGALFSTVRKPACNPPKIDEFGKRLKGLFFPQTRSDAAFGWEIGQNFFTPNTLRRKELIEDDRPYAAWLYGGLFFVVTDHPKAQTQHVVEAQFGIVGPEAGGEFVQREIHEEFDKDDIPQGWDNQLDTEPGLNLIYLGRRRYCFTPECSPNQVIDVVPHFGGALGNIQSYFNAGATVRLGRNISGFPVVNNRMTARAEGVAELPKWELYVFAGAEGRAVFHNIYLDGNNFRDSHSVDKEGLVYDLKAGLSFRIKVRANQDNGEKTSFRLSYTLIRRSREFSPLPQDQEESYHDFGSLSIGFERHF
jgi:hypothetical protein